MRFGLRRVSRAFALTGALVLVPFVMAGCPGVNLGRLSDLLGGGLNNGGNSNPSTQLTLRDVVAGRVFPSIPSANIRIEIQNASGRDSKTRLTLRVGGRRVHFTTRTISAGAGAVVVGPDRADSVLFESELIGDPLVQLAPQAKFLNQDFRNGDTIRFVISTPVVNDCDENGVDDSLQADSDGDGLIDACDGCPQDGAKAEPGACGCGVIDIDADQDGTPDCNDGCPSDPAKTAPGTCGCGTADRDEDGDGTADCADGCPEDPYKAGPGACGCGVPDTDENQDGVIDCVAPEPLQLALLGLGENRVLRAGTLVTFQIKVENASRGAQVRSFARQVVDGEPVEKLIEVTPGDGVLLGAVFSTSDLNPGVYEIFAEVVDGARSLRVSAVGRVIVNAAPVLVFDGPMPQQLATRRIGFTASWAGIDPDDAALIDIFVDRDGELNGNETFVRRDVPANDADDREALIDPIALGLHEDDYYVGGTIRDPLGGVTIYGNSVCLRNRLVGRVPLEALRSGVKQLAGGGGSREFGVSIDASADIDGDGGADVLIGDPQAVGFGDVLSEGAHGGRVLFYSSADLNPGTLGGDGIGPTRVYVEPQNGAYLGESVAFLPYFEWDRNTIGGYPRWRIGMGAPRWSGEALPSAGRVYNVDPYGKSGQFVDLCCLSSYEATILRGERFNFAGSELTALGDVTGDGVPDFAVGAPRVSDRGYVAIVSGAQTGRESDVLPNRAFVIHGESLSGYFGASVRAVSDVDGDGIDELLIGEPFGGAPFLPRNGRAYLVYGSRAFGSVGSAEIETEDLRVTRILGAELDEAAGFAVASGNFDNNFNRDLVIGAPLGADGGGRAYIAYDVDNYAGGTIRLDQLGAVEGPPGARLLGQPGERLGYALAALGDFDGDGYDDLAVGAPESGGQGGAVRLIYGGTRLSGDYTFELFECAFETAELTQGSIVSGRMGTSLSAGDVDYDGAPDLVTGAPTAGATGGAAFIVSGEPVEE